MITTLVVGAGALVAGVVIGFIARGHSKTAQTVAADVAAVEEKIKGN